VVIEALDEGRDCLVLRDFGDLEAHIREASDVVTQRLVLAVTYALEVILIVRLVTHGDEVVDEGLLELCPAIELVLQQAQEPLMTCLIKNNWKIISHYVFIARS
jgi:hypothetical protein